MIDHLRKYYTSFTKSLIGLNRSNKTIVVIFSDILTLIFAFWFSLTLRNNEIYIPDQQTIYLMVFGPLIAVPIFYFLGLYRSLIRYSNYSSMIWIILAVSLYTIIWFIIVLIVGIVDKPYDFLFINWMMSIFFIGGIRYLARWLLLYRVIDQTRVIIYGAGSSGIQLKAAFSYSNEIKVSCFIDDSSSLQGSYVDGVKVYNPDKIADLVSEMKISEVILAIPGLGRNETTKILNTLKKYPVIIREIPSVEDIAKGKISISDLKKINIEDLLKRKSVKPNEMLLSADITNKNVLVSGAGGSIGSQLSREILKLKPKSLLILDISEFSLYTIERELLEADTLFPIVAIIGNINDQSKLQKILKEYEVDTFYHAAAYKHVPLVEKNIIEGVKCNIFGTLSCIRAVSDSNVSSFVFISTDKAVRPTNIMGATKRFAELILQAYAKKIDNQKTLKTRVSIVRFGNVLGSSGSVVPLFRKQIKNGGPVTVTDPDVIRYFMTLEEASQLVIQAGAMGRDGNIFLLDMGEPVRILELARDMIRLSGRTIKDESNDEGDIEIVFTGLRSGEKLYEELLIDGDSIPTSNKKILQANDVGISFENVQKYLDLFDDAIMKHDHIKAKEILQESVDGYKPKV